MLWLAILPRVIPARSFANAPNGRRCSPVSAIPITEKLLLNAGGWQAMKPARELLKSGRVSEAKYEPPLLTYAEGYGLAGAAAGGAAPACASKARSTSRIEIEPQPARERFRSLW